MKQTKANIYNQYGIKYDAAQNKIYHNYFGWIPALLINGNDKLGKGVWTYSTLATNKHYDVTLDTVNGPDPVYIIRTGRGRRPMIIGKCKLSGPAWYDVEKLHRPETIKETFVFPGGPCDVETGGKWLYNVTNAEPLPYDVPVPENAIRHGRTWIEFDEKDVLKWYRF